MRRLAFLVMLAATLAAPPAASAGKLTIGSDLSARAALTQSHPRDWAAWPLAFETGGGGVVAPVQGEVAMVQLKGTVAKAPNYDQHPSFDMFIVVLRPTGDGRNELLGASNPLVYPFGGDDQQISTFDLQKEEPRLCVKPGDIVALSTSGGFGTSDPGFPGPAGGFPDDYYADGHPVRMFGRIPNSSVAVYESPAEDTDNFQVGDKVRGTERRGQELLMRSTIATGDDARPFCRTDEENQGPTVSLPAQSRELAASAGKVSLAVGCTSMRACEGSVFLKSGTALIGDGTFSLAGRSEGTFDLTLNDNGARKLRESGGRLAATAIVRPAGGAKLEEPGFTIVGDPGGGPTPGPGSAGAFPVKPKASVGARKGKVALKVRCEGVSECKGRLALSKRGTFFGSAPFTVPGGSARSVAVKLNAKARQALRQATGATIGVKATAKTSSGAESVLFKLKRA